MLYDEALARRDLRHLQRTGFLVIGVFFGGFLTWSITTSLMGAVAAYGQLMVSGDVKKVQHPIGGVVSQLLVREGDKVTAGSVVLGLDPTQYKANADATRRQLDEVRMQRVRLETERDGLSIVPVPDTLRQRANEPDIEKIIQTEMRLFETRKSNLAGKREQLSFRIEQFKAEINGLQVQLKARQAELDIAKRDLETIKDLFDRKLVPTTRYYGTQRDVTKLEGAIGEILAAIAQSEGRISEARLQIIQTEEDHRLSILDALSQALSREGALIEKLTATEDLLRQVNVLAPVSGTVLRLNVHTVGGVLGPGEVAMLIVPDNAVLEAEIHIPPASIDQVQVGQTTRLKIMAGNQRTTPNIDGMVRLVSADITRPENGVPPFYSVRVTLQPEEVERLQPLKLLAGMQVEAFIETAERSPLEFLTKPLMDQMERTFLER